MADGSLADRLRSLHGFAWTDEDGDRGTLELLPPLHDAQIAALAREWGVAVPAQAREVLRVARGIEGSPLDLVDFAGIGGGAEMEALPHAVPIAHDGYGNYWVADLAPDAERFGPVFFLCHDPSVVVYQCADVGEFLDALLEMTAPPHRGPLDFVHEEAAARVWGGAETAVPREAALASGDALLRGFAASLPPGALVCDMRTPRTGDGFRVVRGRTYVRHPSERVFGIHAAAPDGARAGAADPPGWLGRMIRRITGRVSGRSTVPTRRRGQAILPRGTVAAASAALSYPLSPELR